MKQIILGRHSYTEYPSFSKDDLKRKLTDHGVLIAKNQAKKITSINIQIDKIICSHAKRALQTTEIYKTELQLKNNYQIEDFLYHDYTTQDFLTMVSKQSDALNCLLIVAHNPTLSEIAYRLCPDYNDGMQPSTMVVLNFDTNNWKDIEVYKGQLAHNITP